MPVPSPEVLRFLSTRSSYPAKAMVAPAPNRAELEPILTAALRVPDHGKLEPWRIIVLDRAAMPRIADIAHSRAVELGGDAEKIDKGRGQFDRSHGAVVVISSTKPHEKVPVAEQVLSAGALCMNIVTAATAQGWAASWITGWVSHDATFAARAFGCGPGETVAGIIHLGSAAAPVPDRPRPDLARIVEWVAE